jgi:endonuclease/exonuclease/phosphatase family metal-dependent hydrolase
MTLKVLSLNIWHDQGPWSERARLIRQWIERLESDLIGFQEVLVAEKAWKSRPENGFPPIIVGDFNAEPGSDEIRYMTGLHSLHGESVPFLDAWAVAGDHSLPGEEGQGITWSN